MGPGSSIQGQKKSAACVRRDEETLIGEEFSAARSPHKVLQLWVGAKDFGKVG